jgi:hypothetical protein
VKPGDDLVLTTETEPENCTAKSVSTENKSALKDSPIWNKVPNRLILISRYPAGLSGTNIITTADQVPTVTAPRKVPDTAFDSGQARVPAAPSSCAREIKARPYGCSVRASLDISLDTIRWEDRLIRIRDWRLRGGSQGGPVSFVSGPLLMEGA